MQQVQENVSRLKQMEAAMQFIQQISMMSPEIGQMAMQQGLVDPEAMAQQMQMQTQAPGNGQTEQGTPEERTAKLATGGDNSLAAKQRIRTANVAAPR
jgi:hypothetical protein